MTWVGPRQCAVPLPDEGDCPGGGGDEVARVAGRGGRAAAARTPNRSDNRDGGHRRHLIGHKPPLRLGPTALDFLPAETRSALGIHSAAQRAQQPQPGSYDLPADNTTRPREGPEPAASTQPAPGMVHSSMELN